MEQDIHRMDDTSGDINPYCKIIVNKAERDNIILSQMKQLSILSNVVNYIKYDRHPKNFYNLDIKAIDQKSHKKIHNKAEKRQMLELDFGNTPEKLKGEYLDMYEEIQLELLSTARLDEDSNLSETYLGRVDITRASKYKVEERFPISEQQESNWMEENVRYYWIQGLANCLFPNHNIYVENPFIHYQKLHLKHR